MKISILLLCSLFYATLSSSLPDKNKWVVLVAGSNGWYNYRHQADVCHAYQVLISKGIPPENIITFMYDDIAECEDNPFRGKIFNDYAHKDYYNGVIIDYKGEDVNPKMFMKVLEGDAELEAKGHKVLKSGPKDNVFIYFTDHGSSGLICFPDNDLYALDLMRTLEKMYNTHKYSKLVFYLEACEAGSMFEHILSHKINVYAVTATNSYESSYGIFCDDKDLDTCLADEFSYNWITDTENHVITNRTLKEQFLDVKNRTVRSPVSSYGKQVIKNEYVSEFQGSKLTHLFDEENFIPEVVDSVKSHDIPLHVIQRRLKSAKTEQDRQLYMQILSRSLSLRSLAVETMNMITNLIKMKPPTLLELKVDEKMTCSKSVAKTFRAKCFSNSQVSIVSELMKHLNDLCFEGYKAQVIVNAIMKICV